MSPNTIAARATAALLSMLLASCGATRNIAPTRADELTHLVLVIEESPDGSVTHSWRPFEEAELAKYRLSSNARSMDRRIVLATGDRRDVADSIATNLSLDLVRSELSPDQKILVVLSERKNGPVMMIGDGINDAPALAAADVGVAMGAKGAAASTEAADVVLLVDQLDRVLPAIRIARRSRRIALESVVAGMGLSGIAMIAAAFGILAPVEGAILQEAIDVAVIFNALRALRG